MDMIRSATSDKMKLGVASVWNFDSMKKAGRSQAAQGFSVYLCACISGINHKKQKSVLSE